MILIQNLPKYTKRLVIKYRLLFFVWLVNTNGSVVMLPVGSAVRVLSISDVCVFVETFTVKLVTPILVLNYLFRLRYNVSFSASYASLHYTSRIWTCGRCYVACQTRRAQIVLFYRENKVTQSLVSHTLITILFFVTLDYNIFRNSMTHFDTMTD